MRQNELRGKLLTFLAHVYPEKVEEMAVVGVFYEYHETDDITKALEYLVDKGMVIREEKPHPYRERKTVKLYRISAAGIDLNDGTATDPGVTVVEW